MLNIPFLKNLGGAHKETNKFLTIDIGSDSIKTLAFYQDGLKSKIIGYSKRHIEPGHIRNGTIIDIEGVELFLKESIAEASQNSEDKISNVIFGVSGNYSINQLTTARLNRTERTPITEKELDNLHQKITSSAYEQAVAEVIQTSGSSDIEMDLITSSNCYIKLDEKLVKNPLELEGLRLEMSVFTSFTPTYHLKNLNKLAKKLGLNVIAIAPEMYALVKSLTLQKNPHLDCIIINVGSDKTEIGIIFGGNVIASKCLPMGGSQFTYQISQKMGLSLKEAENLKKNYSTGKLTQNESLLIQDCVMDVLETWLSGIEIVFAEFTGVKTFAPKIFMTGGGISLPDAYEYISKEPWTRSIAFKAAPEFGKIIMTDLTHVTDSTQLVAGTEWVMPAALSYIYLEANELIND
jgi:cell division protein FtsA